ncbi:nuclear transcription factor Y subunit B-9-like [Camellia sinensis]|uniref:nuclear transcription factor Y subunit B-9-like n=1 Tax=Camellia sinensis TaxID=4442 RepID=UPI001036A81F|nr:nuclear transcription factor Y subunit B-9-like [Camellia sinensis]
MGAKDIFTRCYCLIFSNLISALIATKRHRRAKNSNREQSLPVFVSEHDQFMPIANITRIMRRVLPQHAKISDDVKEYVQQCISKFISFITGEANERCHHEQGKTVTAQDILSAMGRLGFEDYVEPLTLFLNHYRGIESEHTLMRGEPFVKRTTGDFVQPGPGNYGPQGFPVTQTQAQGLLDAHAAMMKKGMNSYYGDSRGGGSSSSSQAALPSFDPCGQFKRS